MPEPVRVTDIWTKDGSEVLIEFSNGKVVVLSVKEILEAVASVEQQKPEQMN